MHEKTLYNWPNLETRSSLSKHPITQEIILPGIGNTDAYIIEVKSVQTRSHFQLLMLFLCFLALICTYSMLSLALANTCGDGVPC